MAKPPYDPDKLPPDLQALIPNYTRPTSLKTFVVTPSVMVTPRCQTTPVKQKSYAQVESLVSPPNSGGLKPMRRKRRNPLTVRLSDSDRENIKQKAKAAGCTLNAYVRASLLGSDCPSKLLRSKSVVGLAAMWYVYFLQLSNENVYVGSTNDLKRRYKSHELGQVTSTKPFLPIKLKCYIALETEKDARQLERYFKSGSGKAFAYKRFGLR